MTATALKFQVGARTLATIPRQLRRVGIDLTGALAGRLPVLPPLAQGADGYLITSLAASRLADLAQAAPGLLVHVRQRYARHYADLTLDFADYAARLSSNTRSQLKRKAKRVAEASGGSLDIARFRTAAEIERFHAVARRISERTYQERLLGGGLPGDARFLRAMRAAAAADRGRAWLLTIADTPAAYLYCEADGPNSGTTLRYDHVGHDPAFNDLSPGSVLMHEAFRDLMSGDRFARFDFTEGEGQHKRAFATGGVACVDVLLLRPTLGNRLALIALAGFDRAAAFAKRAANHPALKGLAKKVRRAS